MARRNDGTYWVGSSTNMIERRPDVTAGADNKTAHYRRVPVQAQRQPLASRPCQPSHCYLRCSALGVEGYKITNRRIIQPCRIPKGSNQPMFRAGGGSLSNPLPA